MDNNHFTPFGARVEPPPAVEVRRRPRITYRTMLIVTALLWALAWVSTCNLVIQTYYGLANIEQQLAWDARR